MPPASAPSTRTPLYYDVNGNPVYEEPATGPAMAADPQTYQASPPPPGSPPMATGTEIAPPQGTGPGGTAPPPVEATPPPPLEPGVYEEPYRGPGQYAPRPPAGPGDYSGPYRGPGRYAPPPPAYGPTNTVLGAQIQENASWRGRPDHSPLADPHGVPGPRQGYFTQMEGSPTGRQPVRLTPTPQLPPPPGRAPQYGDPISMAALFSALERGRLGGVRQPMAPEQHLSRDDDWALLDAMLRDLPAPVPHHEIPGPALTAHRRGLFGGGD